MALNELIGVEKARVFENEMKLFLSKCWSVFSRYCIGLVESGCVLSFESINTPCFEYERPGLGGECCGFGCIFRYYTMVVLQSEIWSEKNHAIAGNFVKVHQIVSKLEELQN